MIEQQTEQQVRQQEVYCILCPNACQMEVSFDLEKKEITLVKNNRCERGEKYAAKEIFEPERSVMTVVPVDSKFWKVTSVLTARPVPKEKMFDIYDEIKKIRLKTPVRRGDILISNVCDTGIDVIVTRSVLE